jgi:thioredoxin-related protein
MMKRLIFMAMLVALAACSRNEASSSNTSPAGTGVGGLIWQPSYQVALEKARAEKKILMIDLYTDWCGWCKRLDKDVYANPSVSEKLASRFIALKLNPEKSKEAAELAKKFGTRGFPHIVFVDGAGNKVAEIGGYLPATQFLQRLDSLASAK